MAEETITLKTPVEEEKAHRWRYRKEKRNSELMRRFYEHYKPLQEAQNKL